MKKYNIKLNKSQLDSLKHFIERTQLSGAEVHSFISVVTAINEAESAAGQKRVAKNPVKKQQ